MSSGNANMNELATVLLVLAIGCAAFGLYALFRSQRLRADIDRLAEGSMLGAEFGAFSLPQAELAPDSLARRQCRMWSIAAMSAMICSCLAAAAGLVI